MTSRTAPADPVTTLTLEGLSCASCVGRAQKALLAVPGVADAQVNLATRQARIRHTPDTSETALRDAVAAAGYPAAPPAPRTATLTLEGLSCASCVGRAQKALLAVPGVADAQVNLATRQARIRHAPDTPETALRDAVAAAGYPAAGSAAPRSATPSAPPPTTDPRAREALEMRGRVLIAAVLTLPIVVLEMGGHLVPAFHHWLAARLGPTGGHWLQFLLATAVLGGPGALFFARGLAAARRLAPDMNTLVALGTGAAWAWSSLLLLFPEAMPDGAGGVYFEPAAVIVTLVLVGRWMEARAVGRAGAAIRALMSLAPDKALRLTPGGAEEEVPLSEIRVGDMLAIRPGARVPTDAEILEGRSELDESMLTGEPMPVLRAPGGRVTGGTVNGTGALTVRATAIGGDTALARIARTVEEAQGARLPVQALVDRVTSVFVPAILVIAALTLAVWLAAGAAPGDGVAAAVAVLIVACPCALGLATPISILVGTGRAAELGVLFRRGAALERLPSVRAIGFDKTGTLTEGRPAVTRILPAPGWTVAGLMRIAGGAEARSEHPVAAAIAQAARAEGALAEATEVRAEIGAGLSAVVEGRAVRIGNARYLDAEGIDAAPLEGSRAALEADGATAILVAIDGQAAGVIGLADRIRAGAAEAVAATRALGLVPVMLTGDAPAPARIVAERLGIDDVRAGLRPDDKRAAVAELKALHGAVALVGDGINDAPALAEADVGIAVGTGTDIAIEAADVVIMGDDPRHVPVALEMGRATLRNIRQNLFWAFAYNTALIPVAAGVLVPFGGPSLSPALAGAAMAASSVCVVANALRLRRAGRKLAPRAAKPQSGPAEQAALATPAQ